MLVLWMLLIRYVIYASDAGFMDAADTLRDLGSMRV